MAAVNPVQQEGQEQDATELEWTDECNELLDQVLETQTEIAHLLQRHDSNTESLSAMKKQCDDELLELQDDAWKLQVFVELQRMGQQLERLDAASRDSSTTNMKVASCADKPAQSSSAEHSPRAACDDGSKELEVLDREIADVQDQLVAARAELAGLLEQKVSVEGEVELVGQQLEALATGSDE